MARIQTLGLPAGPVARPPAAIAPAPAAAAEPHMVEMGTTGTGIFGRGYIRELGEYNSLFSGGPFSAYPTFEQMRRGDAQVAGVLLAQKSPVRGAEWKMQPPKDATPIEMEAAEDCEHCLLDEIDFDRAVENTLLAMDFGASCHEDIYTITNGKVRLAKLAARLPLTFYNWVLDEREDLQALIQHGFHGGAYSEYTLPANKIALYTFRQEGANFAGRAILREMYQHWYTKAALYKIDAIACERNGMGVPVATLAPNASKEDRQTLERFLSQMAVHQNAYAMLPHDYTLEFKAPMGQVRNCMESITHHNMMIAMAALLGFLVMGQGSSSSGNRSLGETMSDFFFLALQSLANQVGDVYSDATIARLVLYNYGPGVRPPRLVPQKINALKFGEVTEALAKLGTSGLLTPDPDMEVWLRRQMGAPEVDKAEIARLREKTVTSGAGTPAAPAEAGLEEKKVPVPEPGANKKVAASETVDTVPTRRAPGVPPKGKTFTGRGAKAELCLALSETVSTLNRGREEVAAALRDARSRVQVEIIHKLVDQPVRNMHRVSIALDEKLVAQVEEILRAVAGFGREQVEKERGRQLGGAAPSTASTIRAAERKARDQVGLYADGVVSEFTNNLQQRAANIALDLQKRGGKTKGELINEIGAELDDQSDKWIDGVSGKGANGAFADGRDEGFAEHADEIGSYIYSALLDINTCEACAAADGMESETEDGIPDVPNPDCDGGDRCRCVVVAVFKDEGRKAA